MNVSNIETGYVEGIKNPYTKVTLSVPRSSTGTGNTTGATSPGQQKKYSPADNVFVNNAGEIPSRPSLKKPCDNDKCRKRPDQAGSGYAGCSECKIARYCSRECQRSHWKAHKNLCKVLTEDAKKGPKFEADALRNGRGYVSQAALRKWYYDNVDIVNYAVIQCLELYKGIDQSRWRTHAVLFYLKGGKLGTSVTADEMSFSDAEEIPFNDPNLPDFTAPLIPAFGAGRRIILLFMLYQERDLMLVEDFPLPEPGDGEWAKMEKDEMWRMHIRMRKIARKVVHGEQ
ncbi:MYND-type domain-containing protein [Mycena chlorophos]|uniref:MYND-type domain-containing protein n=1 Tax=Mycena chlorophos TaxID=658473 RepID=A0A8H6TSX6_MYCCL|nr:MYND-type domain-containing protein [Mycena chlorophos]